MFHRNREADERKRDRQRREDAAPRLSAEVPPLRTLRLAISCRRGTSTLGDAAHVRIVVVASAPALFVVPCADRSCRDGGHDITSQVMQALRSGLTHFEGDDPCHGSLGAGGSPCTAILTFDGTATYG